MATKTKSRRKSRMILAVTGKNPQSPMFYAGLNKRGGKHYTTPTEEWRVCLLGMSGYSYKAIARMVYYNGDLKAAVANADINRVSKILSANKIKVRDYRDMRTDEAKTLANILMRRSQSAGLPRLKIA